MLKITGGKQDTAEVIVVGGALEEKLLKEILRRYLQIIKDSEAFSTPGSCRSTTF